MKAIPLATATLLALLVVPLSQTWRGEQPTSAAAAHPTAPNPVLTAAAAIAPPGERSGPVSAWSDLPAGEQKSIGEQIREAQYWFTAHEAQWERGAGLFAPCPGQRMAVHADARGVKVMAGDAALGLETIGAAPVAPRAEANRLVYDRGGGVEEWFVNTPAGLEQGWTVREEVQVDSSDRTALSFTLRLRTSLTPRQSDENGRISFRDADGADRFHYDKLLARDATGRALPATMSLAEDGAAILLAVQDAGAVYPVTVDPLVFTGPSFAGEFTSESFGNALAVSGTTLAVGTDTSTEGQEAVYIFEEGMSGWQQVKKITAPAGAAAIFGFSVAVDGDRLVAGSRSSQATQTAHIFERNSGGNNNWGLVKTLVPSPVTNPGFFGEAVAASGDTVAVGGFRENGITTDTGAVSIFQKDQGGAGVWGLQRRVFAADGSPGDHFGEDIALQGSRLIVGAANDDDTGFNGGAAYIFEQNQGGANLWGQVKKLAPAAPDDGGFFGNAVSLDAVRVVVGEIGSDTSGSDNGAAHVFRQNQGGAGNWGLEQSLFVVDAAGNNTAFGSSVSLRGTRCLIGAVNFDSLGLTNQRGGAAFVFELSGATWTRTLDLLPEVPQSNGSFGNAVALGDGVLAVANRAESVSTLAGAGRVQIYQELDSGPDWAFRAAPAVAAPGAVSLADLGFTVALDGSTLVIGAPNSDDTADPGSGEGAAFVFERNQGGADAWQLKRRLLASGLGVNSGFGSSVTVAGDFIAVGAPNLGTVGSAAVWRKEFTGFAPVRTVAQSAGSFGSRLALDDGFLAVGAALDDLPTTDQGSAFLFRRNGGGEDNWGLVKKIAANDGATGDAFGNSIALSNGFLAVGASEDDDRGAGSGSAYIFARNQGGADQWGQVRKITESDGAVSDQLGSFIALHEEVLVIGTFGPEVAYIHERNQGGSDVWGLSRKVSATADVLFSVAVHGHTVVLGCRSGLTSGGGGVDIFSRNSGGAGNWGLLKFIPPPEDADTFGTDVAISGDLLVVGADLDDDGGADAGAAFVFQRNRGGTNNWGLARKLAPAGLAADANFGDRVAIERSRIVASRVDDGVASVHVFEQNLGGPDAWGESARLTHPGFAGAGSVGSARVSLAALGPHLQTLGGLDLSPGRCGMAVSGTVPGASHGKFVVNGTVLVTNGTLELTDDAALGGPRGGKSFSQPSLNLQDKGGH